MAWIESHQSLERHPKTLDLMARMGWDLDTTIGKLQRFWWWCVDYSESGDLRKHNDSILGAAVGLNSDRSVEFKKAMVEACWLDRDPYFRVHDWWKYIGKFLQIKYKHDPEKWRLVRDAYAECSENGSDNRIPNQPNQPTNQDAGVVGEVREFPRALDTPRFRESWQEWQNHRTEIKKKMTPLAAKKQMNACEKMGVDRAVAAIEHSIAGGYQGIFEPNGRHAPQQKPADYRPVSGFKG